MEISVYMKVKAAHLGSSQESAAIAGKKGPEAGLLGGCAAFWRRA